MVFARTVFQALCVCFCLAASAAAPAATRAVAPAAPPNPNETCLMCHAAADAKGAGGKSIAVDGAKFGASVHGELKLKCTDCHADVSADRLPHPEKLKPVNCATCHEKAVKEYAGTVHGVARKGGNAVAATCTDCHGTHDIARAKGPIRARITRTSRPPATSATAAMPSSPRASFPAATSAANSTTASTAKR